LHETLEKSLDSRYLTDVCHILATRRGGYPRREFVTRVTKKNLVAAVYFAAPSKFKLHTHVTKRQFVAGAFNKKWRRLFYANPLK